ncbi:hypothetical protein [Streptomonospora litoralis]|uniref:hypothetical protein n=1 Tax=Streptomonospora litoralis TaxID=2498135 RepID=UPI0013F16B8D|nr:hypothetical protein [Streptomonospora litoralis]
MTKFSGILWEFGHDRRGRLRDVGHVSYCGMGHIEFPAHEWQAFLADLVADEL